MSNKSKKWIKSLLIVVLALLMVATLVACNDDKGSNSKPQPPVTDSSTAEYFNKLWSLTSAIGSEKIGEKDTIALDLGMELTLNFVGTKKSDTTIYQQIDLGVEIQALVGRDTTTSKDTAVKIRLYDPTNTVNNGQILTLYLFANELENLYLDFAGQSVVVPQTVAQTIWNDVLGNKTNLGDEIVNGLNNKFIGKDGEKQSINDIINTFVGKFGENWNLNTLINGLVSMFDLDLDALIGKIPSALLPVLGVNSAADLKDANGNIDLMKLLSGKTIGTAFVISESKVGNATVHKAQITDDILGILVGALKANKLLGKEGTNELSLSFTEENNVIKDFSIFAKLGGLDGRSGNVSVIPALNLKINKLKIKNATTNKDDYKIVINKSNYSSDIALNEKLAIKLDGISYRGTDLSGKTIELSLVGKIDMKEADTKKNKTAINVTVDEITTAATKHLVQASYKNGILAASLDKAITFNGKQYKGVKIDVSEKFNVVDLVTKGIKEIVYKIAPDRRPVKEDKDNEGSATTSDDNTQQAKPTLADYIEILKKLVRITMPMVSTNNNGIQIDISNASVVASQFNEDTSILGIIVTYVNTVNKTNTNHKEWTVQGSNENLINNLIYPPLAGKGLQDCLNIILQEFNIDLSDFGAATADDTTVGTPVTPEEEDKVDWKVIGDAVLQILFNIANDLTVDGVSDADFTKAEIESIIGQKFEADNKTVIEVSDNTLAKWNENKVYIRTILALVQTKSCVIKGDLNGGVHASVQFEVAGATVEINESLNLIEEFTFVDVAELYDQDVEAGNGDLWINYVWTDKAE